MLLCGIYASSLNVFLLACSFLTSSLVDLLFFTILCWVTFGLGCIDICIGTSVPFSLPSLIASRGFGLLVKHYRSAKNGIQWKHMLDDPKSRLILLNSSKIVYHVVNNVFVVVRSKRSAFDHDSFCFSVMGYRFYTLPGLMVLHFWTKLFFWSTATLFGFHFIDTYERANLAQSRKNIASRTAGSD